MVDKSIIMLYLLTNRVGGVPELNFSDKTYTFPNDKNDVFDPKDTCGDP